jgi:hypothetical protein
MYPLRMTRSLAVAAGVAALVVPGSAWAAELTVSPQKRCYSAGESVNLLGAGFSPLGSATVTRDGSVIGELSTDANGAFNGVLRHLEQNSDRRTKTYTARDATNPSLTASIQILVSAVRVGLTPASGPPGRVLTVTARGFTTGDTLWAHVRHGKSTRNLKIGQLEGACGGLKTRKRLLPRDASFGIHRMQFDTFRRYSPKRPVRDLYTITVS